LDLAAWAREVQKRLEADGFTASAAAFAELADEAGVNGLTLTDADRKFLSGLKISEE